MDKKVFTWHGKKYYLLGENRDGERYCLMQGHFDCGWSWGLGYVRTFTNNKNPHLSKDIISHDHFDYMFFKDRSKSGYDKFKDFFAETPLTDKEIWTLLELMKSAYTCREYSDMLHTGGAHYTTNPCRYIIPNATEYNRINTEVIPAILKEVYKVLGEEN